MKKLCSALSAVLLTSILSSCGYNPIEDLTISLILGIDLDEDNNLIFSQSSPVFNKEAKKNVEVYQLKANSIRESRQYFDAIATGDVTAAKIQVLLLGKRLLEHENWFSILDTIYRNPNFSLSTKVVMVDGKVSDVIFFEPEEKAQLPLHLNEMIDNNINRTRTENTTLQVLHRYMYEKGVTPSMPEIKREKDIKLSGISLLDKNGKYIESLGIEESSLLLILMDEKKEELTLSFPLTTLEKDGGIFHENEISILLRKVSPKIKTKYKDGKFQFDYNITMTVSLVEQIFSSNKVTKEELEKLIEKELESRFNKLIKKFQDLKIDPIGLGIYARAFQYDEYKKVEDDWGAAFSEAEVNVSVDVKMISLGVTS